MTMSGSTRVPALSSRRLVVRTSPARMARCASSRDSKSPRSTSKTSSRGFSRFDFKMLRGLAVNPSFETLQQRLEIGAALRGYGVHFYLRKIAPKRGDMIPGLGEIHLVGHD